MRPLTLFSALLFFFLSACDRSSPPPPVSEWKQLQAERQAAHARYLEEHQVAWDWFADFPFGRDDTPSCLPSEANQCGVPYVLFKLLPRLAPEIWGTRDNFLAVVGLFEDERTPGRPVARGIGWTGLARDANLLTERADHASFTCGACHIGRVRLENGNIEYIDGGINTEFDIVSYRVKVFQTIQALLGEEDPAKVLALLAAAQQGQPAEALNSAVGKVMSALDAAVAESPTYFYGDYAYGDRSFDAGYEAQQVALFRRDAAAHVAKFIGFATIEYMAFGNLVENNYKDYAAGILAGMPGMADATGISNSLPVMLYQLDGEKFPEFAAVRLPPTPGITDFMAPWEQHKRKARWNENHTALIDGGGQYNGNIPIPIFRTLAAEMVMGYGANTDLRISALAQELLDGLPAATWPFDVDMELAETGEALFEANCASCHKPNNGEVFDIGTDLGRAYVVSETGTAWARKGLTAFCSPETEVDVPGRGPEKPCAEFEGVSLAGDNYVFAFADAEATRGYQALPLGGVWALAPYLHNGSVPTLYHLLMPTQRPDAFVKGRLDYDTEWVGFAWRDGAGSGAAYTFDTTALPALSKTGHDQDVEHDGQLRKLDWSDDEEGALAIIEYLKTF